MAKMLFVYNPFSGKGQIGSYLAEIIDIFTKGGYDVTVRPTQSKDDAYLTVRDRAGEFDVVACSGGDGTMNEVLKGIMDGGHHVPVGYIPAGTMNDFASSLGISKFMPDAAHTIAEGTPRFVDIGGFNDKYFTYVAAFGAFTNVSYETDQQMKNTFGALAYIAEAFKTIDREKNYIITIKAGDKTVTDSFIFGMVANSLSVGGIKGLAGYDVSMNDGIFEGIFIKKPTTLIEFQQTLNALIRRELDAPYFYYFKSSEFEFTGDSPIPWTIDGEFGGSCKHVSLSVFHDALKIILNEDNAPLITDAEIKTE
ncbi:MAG: diacylglycerol/lipid kinase family protein [Huintestinicola sp.]